MADELLTLAARVAAAQALAAAATPGPWKSGRNGRLRMVVSAEHATPTGRRWQMRADVGTAGGVANEDADAELLAAAPDLAALVAELWAEVERLIAREWVGTEPWITDLEWVIAEREKAERERDEARRDLARIVALCGWDCDGNDPETPAGAYHLYGSAVQAVRELRAELDEAHAEIAQHEAEQRADEAVRKDIGVRLGLQSADDSPSCLADFEDAITEARAEAARLRALLPTAGPTWGEHCAGLADNPPSVRDRILSAIATEPDPKPGTDADVLADAALGVRGTTTTTKEG